MPYDKNVLAANLRAFRARARMKQSEVAAAVGGIGYETAWALADLFGVTLGELGGREERKAG